MIVMLLWRVSLSSTDSGSGRNVENQSTNRPASLEENGAHKFLLSFSLRVKKHARHISLDIMCDFKTFPNLISSEFDKEK